MAKNVFNFEYFLSVIFLFRCAEFLEIFVKPATFPYKIQLHCRVDEFTPIDFGTKLQREGEEKTAFDLPKTLALFPFCFEQKLAVSIFKSVGNDEPNKAAVPLNTPTDFQFVKKFEIRSSVTAKNSAMLFDVSDGPKVRISLGENPSPFYFAVTIKCELSGDANGGVKIAIFGTTISMSSEFEAINIGNLEELDKCKEDKVHIEASKGDEWKATTMSTSEFTTKLGETLELNFSELMDIPLDQDDL